jgi:hypothetical protein
MSLTSASEAERKAERLRSDLTVTVDQIVDNLRPSHLAAEAFAVTRAHAPDWMRRTWSLARSPAGLAIIGGVLVAGLAGASRRRRLGRRS